MMRQKWLRGRVDNKNFKKCKEGTEPYTKEYKGKQTIIHPFWLYETVCKNYKDKQWWIHQVDASSIFGMGLQREISPGERW